MTDPWPWPGDTPTERARRIANSLLALLPDQERDHAIRQARAVGETWLGRNLLRWTNDDVIPPGEAAGLVHATPDLLCSCARGVATASGMCWMLPPRCAVGARRARGTWLRNRDPYVLMREEESAQTGQDSSLRRSPRPAPHRGR